VPQKAHQDHDSSITDEELETLGIKSLIGFTPISEDGMMVVVWTEGKPKKYRSKAMVEIDEKRISKNFDVAPGQYYLYIPKGVFVALPADTIHAGGFCFGKKEPLPVPPNKKSSKAKKNLKTSPDEIFQNHHLHFSFLCSDIVYNKAIQETNITLIEENEEDLMKDYLPDDNIMNNLFECLLDCHHKLAPPVRATKSEIKAKNKPPRLMLLP